MYLEIKFTAKNWSDLYNFYSRPKVIFLEVLSDNIYIYIYIFLLFFAEFELLIFHTIL